MVDETKKQYEQLFSFLSRFFMYIGVILTTLIIAFVGFIYWGFEEMQKGCAGHYSWEKWFEKK